MSSGHSGIVYCLIESSSFFSVAFRSLKLLAVKEMLVPSAYMVTWLLSRHNGRSLISINRDHLLFSMANLSKLGVFQRSKGRGRAKFSWGQVPPPQIFPCFARALFQFAPPILNFIATDLLLYTVSIKGPNSCW